MTTITTTKNNSMKLSMESLHYLNLSLYSYNQMKNWKHQIIPF